MQRWIEAIRIPVTYVQKKVSEVIVIVKMPKLQLHFKKVRHILTMSL